jgi:hypothetical protein
MRNMWWAIVAIGASFLLACLVRKFASHTLINGFMSKEQADDVFPERRKQDNDKQDNDN